MDKWNKLKNKATVDKETIETKRLSRDKIYVVCTKDDLCVFLDRNTKQCVIYNDRPLLCRAYGVDERLPCPFLMPDGSRRPVEKIKDWEETVDNDLKNLKKKMIIND